MKNKAIQFVIFLLIWAVIYWLSKWNFGVISFLLACLFVYQKNAEDDKLIMLAKEFDRNHNALAHRFDELQRQIDDLKEENQYLKDKIQK